MSVQNISQNAPKINIDAIPEELKTTAQWLCWRATLKDGKITKVPYDAKSGKLGSSTNPETWASFDQALAAYQNGNGYNGIGFALENTRLVGVDLDHCRNATTGEVEAWALEIVKKLDSYTEITPSSEGLRVFLYGKIKNPGNKKGNIECYDSGRFLTVTGQHLEGTPEILEHRQGEFDQFHAGVFGGTKKVETPPPVISNLDETETIRRAINAKNGEDFRRLYAGDWSEYPSQSEADLAFCSLLAFWTGRDPAKIESIFRASGLRREKTDQHYADGSSYLSRTITKAINSTSEVYQARKEPEHHHGVLDKSTTSPRHEETAIMESFNFTDMGNAQRLVAKYSKNIRYCHAWGAWLIWDGRRWAKDETNEITRMAKETVRGIYAEAAAVLDDDLRKALASHARKSESEARLRAMINVAESEPGIPATPGGFDNNKWLLNVLNGTIDLKTGKLLPHDREDLITKLAPVRYDLDAECDLWFEFLERIMDKNEALIGFLQRVSGYALTGETYEHCLFFLYGLGANGKSVFTETIRTILGDYARQTPISTFLTNHNDSVAHDLARLKGSRLVSAAECEAGHRLAESLVKQLTGGDKIAARFLFKEFFEYHPEFKIFIATNRKPSITGTDTGIWRRICLIPFNVQIPPEEQDRHLTEKLRAELAGILNWLILGCLEWQRSGLERPDEVQAATQEYRGEMDILTGFLDEKCFLTSGMSVEASDLFRVYEEWALQNNERAKSQTKFGMALSERGFKRERSTITGRYRWHGIGLSV